MKCPLFTAGNLERFPPDNEEFLVCLQEECAWWYKENDCCSVLTLAQGSTYMHKELLAIREKMPHEKQFRK